MTDATTTIVDCKIVVQCNIHGPCSIDAFGGCSEIASISLEHGVLTLVAPEIASAHHLTYQVTRNEANKHVFSIVGPREAQLQINGRNTTVGEVVKCVDSKTKPAPPPQHVLPRVKLSGKPICLLSLFDGGLFGDVTIAKELLADSLTVNVNGGQSLWLPDDAVFDNLLLNICSGSVHARNVRARNLEIVCFNGSASGLRAIRTVRLVSVGASSIDVASDSGVKARIYVHDGRVVLNGQQHGPTDVIY